jgi:hypothetical protein
MGSVFLHKVTMQFEKAVEVKGHTEYEFAAWLHELKYRCEGLDLKFDILNTELLDVSLSEESLRFEVVVIEPDGKEGRAFTVQTAKQIVNAARERVPDQSVRVKLWHWSNPVALPSLDGERLEILVLSVRQPHLRGLSNLMVVDSKTGRCLLKYDAIVRGILAAVLSMRLDLKDARSEHEVRNIVLRAMGREALPLPAPWEFQVVIEFADGHLIDEDRERANKILTQEVARRRKAGLPLDCWLRRRRCDDRFVTYIHPAPTRGKRKRTLPMGEWTDGAGI